MADIMGTRTPKRESPLPTPPLPPPPPPPNAVLEPRVWNVPLLKNVIYIIWSIMKRP